MTFWMVVVSLLPLAAVAGIIYFRNAENIKNEAFTKLTAIRDLKVSEINGWVDQRVGDAETIADDPSIRAIGIMATAPSAGRQTPAVEGIITEIRDHFSHYLRNYTAYNEIFILAPRTGKVLVSTNRAHEGVDESGNPYFFQTVKKNAVYLQEVYYSKMFHSLFMAVAIPIRPASEPDDTKRIAGILVGRINIAHSLFALLADRTGMGATGETLIVNRHRLALNPLRWHPDAPLNFTISAQPAVRAAEGKTGVIEALDYRNVPVLAAYTYLPKLRWGFVAKVDQSEVYQPIAQTLRYILMVLFFSAVVVFILAFFLSDRLTRPITELADVAGEITAGDLSARSRVSDGDEVGFLGRSFNLMADTLTARMDVQQGMAEINDTMVRAAAVNEFAETLIRKLMEITGSCFGAFYLRNPETRRFEPVYAAGMSREALAPFETDHAEGELGKALAERKISHIRNISPDTVFTFKAVAGTVVPKEIVTIPLFARKEAAALISLGALAVYSDETMDMLTRIHGGMDIALSNLINSQATRVLAEQLREKNQDLAAQAEELEAQARELESQTLELEAQNMQLDLQKQQIETTNRLKSEFLSNMSHELRTPLNSVLALSRVLILQTGERLSDEEKNFLGIIERNGKQLLTLINDILDLSKIEAGRFDVVPTSVSIRSIIDILCERLEPVASAKGIGIRQELPEVLPQMFSDEGRIAQILENLIGNAVKFTDTGTVTVSVRVDGDAIVMDVTDTGIGIPASDLPNIFEEFRQVDGTASRRHEGTGLGLAIAHKTAILLGGRIDVVSTPAKGSTFSVRLPIQWAGIPGEREWGNGAASDRHPPGDGAAPMAAAPPVRSSLPGAGALPQTAMPASAQNGKRLLLVEDNEAAIIQVKSVLEADGYMIDVARGGQAAIDYVAKTIPDGIILDLMMPGIDGFAVLEKVRGAPATATIPVLILTAKDLSKEDLGKLSANHVRQLIQKGDVDRDSLVEKVRAMLDTPWGAVQTEAAGDREAGAFPKAAQRAPSISSGPTTLLIVDDHADNRTAFKAILSPDYRILEAEDGVAGITAIRTEVPDLVLLDIALPKMDGFSVVRKIKTDPHFRHIPVIALTAKAMKGDREEALAAGYDDYLAKPVDPEQLMQTVKHWLNR